MTDPASQVHGWGYEGRSVDDLISFATTTNATVVVDVRLNPLSRRPGFSKRKLQDALANAGVRYLHLPALGNPRDNRSAFGERGTAAARAARERYREDVLSTDAARDALTEIRLLAETTHVIVLCVEADENGCHRQLVIEAARALRPAVVR